MSCGKVGDSINMELFAHAFLRTSAKKTTCGKHRAIPPRLARFMQGEVGAQSWAHRAVKAQAPKQVSSWRQNIFPRMKTVGALFPYM